MSISLLTPKERTGLLKIFKTALSLKAGQYSDEEILTMLWPFLEGQVYMILLARDEE